MPSGTTETDVYVRSYGAGDSIPRAISVNFISINQAGTMKAYTRSNLTGTWRAVDFAVNGGAALFPMAVAASSDGADNNILIDVSSYPFVRFTFTPSVALATWEVTVVEHW